MVIKWSDFSKTNLKNFIHYSKLSSPKIYVKNLVSSVSLLADNPKAGKIIAYKDKLEIHQLIYKMHIDAVLHAHYDIDKYINNNKD